MKKEIFLIVCLLVGLVGWKSADYLGWDEDIVIAFALLQLICLVIILCRMIHLFIQGRW